MRPAIYIVAFIVITLTLAFIIRSSNLFETKSGSNGVKTTVNNKGDNPKNGNAQTVSEKNDKPDVTIRKKYEVPEILTEISAIAYLDKERFACIQDELGRLFIYNIRKEEIESEFSFAGEGDYEGVAIVGKTAYILRSDGKIFEVEDFTNQNSKVKDYKTHLTSKNDAEGLCYDESNGRLLVTVKSDEKKDDKQKGIYAFSLSTKTLSDEPVYTIDLSHKVFGKDSGKKSAFQPSAIAVHPQTDEIFLLEGTDPKLLILNKSGQIKSLLKLKKSDFSQPEGLSFSADGKLFICNEGDKEPGNILEIAGF